MIRNLPVLVVGTLACVVPGQKSDVKTTDWEAMVQKANTDRRVMMRRAVSRKVAAAGDAAIAAVRAFEKKNGRDAINLDFVTGYGRVDSRGGATHALLEEWARDRNFYWRSQALGALANRRLKRYEKLFLSRLTDPAYLTRIQAGRGLCLLAVKRDKVLELLVDPDPRVRLRVAICLAEEKDDRGLPTLVEALRQEAEFFDYAWGANGAFTALKTLRKVAGEEFGYAIGEPVKKNSAAIAGFEKFAKKRLEGRWVDPIPAYRDDTSYLGWAVIRSCRNGDLHVRFTKDRRIVFGLEARAEIELSEESWRELWNISPGKGKGVYGKVICDYLRIMCNNPTVDEKFCPGAMPKKTSDWLRALGVALEKNGRQDLAKQLESRLPQFSVPRIP